MTFINLAQRLLLFVVTFFFVAKSHALIIETRQGNLKGLVLKSRNGANYDAFLGIPYAKPPVGNLRFEPPQPPDSWNGVRDATKPPPVCVQKNLLSLATGKSIIEGQEDCLYLNVYKPSNIKIASGLPVMVWIHGGAFIVGSGYFYNPEYFLDHEIIMVTFNYRLGVLGFLSAADEILSGNYGMKDQVAALKWVQQNIADFGGDARRVTIFGESAGGASVHFQMHSPLSRGLFQRAISQSGTALASWTQTPPAVAQKKFQSFGILAGCSTASTRELVRCLKKIPAEELLKIEQKFYVWNTKLMSTFSIVAEPASVKDAFLKENPWKQNVLQDVPWIVGLTSGEGIIVAAMLLANDGKLAEELNDNYKRLLPVIFSYRFWLKFDDLDRIAGILKEYYFGANKIGVKTASNLVDMMSDGFFVYDVIEAAIRHTNKLFVYYYDHKGEPWLSKIFNCSIDFDGVSHGEDLSSFFPLFITSDVNNLTTADFHVSERMIKYWVNFAYTGEPTSDNSWRPSESEYLDYLHITTEDDSMKNNLLHDRYTFWKNLSVHPSHIDINEKFIRDEL